MSAGDFFDCLSANKQQYHYQGKHNPKLARQTNVKRRLQISLSNRILTMLFHPI
jgi:hypothetical protein